MLYLPLTPATEYVANGTRLEEDSFAILEPGSEFCISTKVAHDWGVVSVPVDAVAAVGGCVGPNGGTRTVRVAPADRAAADRFRSVLREVMVTAAACPQFESSPAARGAAAELLAIASSVLGRSPASDTRPSRRRAIPRDQVIRRCHEMLERHQDSPVHVGELADAAGVSERTLRTIFHEFFGVGPLRYLHLRQLHRVHHALQVAAPEAVSVGQVLVANGVWELGRFAGRYHRHFGEYPSATLTSRR